MDTNVLRDPIRPVIDDVLRDPINGSGTAGTGAPPSAADNLLLESGDNLLLESGDLILLE